MKHLLILFIFLISLNVSYADNILVPAIQLNLNDYKNYFKKSIDYKVNLRSLSDYKITCNADIVGVKWGDIDNIGMFDIKNEYDVLNMKSLIMKLKYETYTYVRLYQSSGEITNIILSVSPMFRGDMNINLGLCEIVPYRG